MQEREIKDLVDRITKGPEAEAKFVNGSTVLLNGRGRPYVLENVHDTAHGRRATIRRALPKVKGKAARKAERAARRAGVFAR